MLRIFCRQQLLPAVDGLLPAVSTPLSAQLLRGAKAAPKKKAQPVKGKGQKGKQQPAKKQKQKMESKPFDEKEPLVQKVIAMLVSPTAEQPAARTSQQQVEMAVRAKQFSRLKMQEHAQWQQDMRTKLRLKQAALQALPPALREAALIEDLTPFRSRDTFCMTARQRLTKTEAMQSGVQIMWIISMLGLKQSADYTASHVYTQLM